MSVFFEAFGHYTYHWANESKCLHETGVIPINVINVIGTIPGAGIATGVIRWYIVSQMKPNELLPFKIGEVVRGIFEFLGLGFIVLLFVDIPVDIGRYCCKQQSTYDEIPHQTND